MRLIFYIYRTLILLGDVQHHQNTYLHRSMVSGGNSMKLMPLVLIVVVVVYFFSSFMITNGNEITPCNYTAIYNFGDSNSDTGGIAAAFYPPGPPSGITYFHRPAGRASDGRLIIDFIGNEKLIDYLLININLSFHFFCFVFEAEELGIPYLSPYLDSIGSNYKHGANFATGGATIQRPNESWTANGISPFSLDIQIEHFTQFRDRSAYAYNQAQDEFIKQRLPKPDEDISRALFTLDIGQNDIAFGIRTMSLHFQLEALPKIVSQFVTQVKASRSLTPLIFVFLHLPITSYIY